MKSFFEKTILQLFKTNSIRSKLKISFLLIILIVLIPSIMSITFSSILTVRYGKLIHNVDDANSLNKIVKFVITNEIWDIVSGKKGFTEGEQYSIIENIYERLNVLARNASTKETASLSKLPEEPCPPLKTMWTDLDSR